MRMRMRASGVNEARLFLQNVGSRTTKALREEMRQVAEDTAKLAKLMTPVDRNYGGSLRDSIEVVEQQSSSHRYHVSIRAGGPGHTTPEGEPVSRYAAIIHENYESMLSDPETIAHRDKLSRINGQEVGSKFLTRALEATDKTLANRLGKVLLLIGGIES